MMNQDNSEWITLLQKLVTENEMQNRQLKKQLFYTRIFAAMGLVLAILLAVVVFWVVPPALSAMETATAAMEQASDTLALVDETLLDVQSLFEEDGLIVQSSEALAQAMEKIDRMDIDSLNQAIQNLKDVVEPMADFFGRFKR